MSAQQDERIKCDERIPGGPFNSGEQKVIGSIYRKGNDHESDSRTDNEGRADRTGSCPF